MNRHFVTGGVFIGGNTGSSSATTGTNTYTNEEIKAIEDQQDANTLDIKTNSSNIEVTTAVTGSLATQQTLNTNNIAALISQQTALEAQTSVLETQQDVHETSITALQTIQNEHDTSIDTINLQIGTIVPGVALNSTNITALTTQQTANTNSINTITTQQTNQDNSISALNTQQTANTNSISQLNTDVANRYTKAETDTKLNGYIPGSLVTLPTNANEQSYTISHGTAFNTGLRVQQTQGSYASFFLNAPNPNHELQFYVGGNIAAVRTNSNHRIKFNAGGYTQPDSFTIELNNTVTFHQGFTNNSDDRIKENEILITDATQTLMKLRPQIYDKKPSINHNDPSQWKKEAGLIAQEVYYDVPELRYLVGNVASEVDPNNPIFTGENPQIDPDYTIWGDEPASFNYLGLIPYLIKANNELNERITLLEQRLSL